MVYLIISEVFRQSEWKIVLKYSSNVLCVTIQYQHCDVTQYTMQWQNNLLLKATQNQMIHEQNTPTSLCSDKICIIRYSATNTIFVLLEFRVGLKVGKSSNHINIMLEEHCAHCFYCWNLLSTVLTTGNKIWACSTNRQKTDYCKWVQTKKLQSISSCFQNHCCIQNPGNAIPKKSNI